MYRHRANGSLDNAIERFPTLLTEGLSSNNITILLADDHPLLRKALRIVLQTQNDFEIVAEANDGEEALRAAIEFMPNVVIIDISMPKMNGIDAIRKIKENCSDTSVLVLTVHDDFEHVYKAIEAGADAYITKSVFDDEVITAVRNVSAGQTVFSQPISKQLVKGIFQTMIRPKYLEPSEQITAKEMEALKLLADGKSNKDIANEMHVSIRTVKSHITQLLSKLGASSRTEAVIIAIKKGFIHLS